MAIAIQGWRTEKNGSSDVSTAQTYNPTIPSGSNRALFVCTAWAGFSSPSSVTWNGDALTSLDDTYRSVDVSGTPYRIKWWYMVAPDVGSYDLIVTPGDTWSDLLVGMVWMTGVKQTSTVDSQDDNGAASGAPSLSGISTAIDNMYVLAATLVRAGDAADVSTDGECSPVDSIARGDDLGAVLNVAYIEAPSSGGRSVAWSSSGDNWVAGGFAIYPSVSSIDPVRIRRYHPLARHWIIG